MRNKRVLQFESAMSCDFLPVWFHILVTPVQGFLPQKGVLSLTFFLSQGLLVGFLLAQQALGVCAQSHELVQNKEGNMAEVRGGRKQRLRFRAALDQLQLIVSLCPGGH